MCKRIFWFFVVAIILATCIPSWATIVTDDFNTPRNYLTNPPPFGIWNAKIGNSPMANSESAYQINADINTPGRLHLAIDDETSWETEAGFPPARARGPFLYRNVNSNYWIMQVKIISATQNTWNLGGLMVRAKVNPDTGVGDEAGTGEDVIGFGWFRVAGYNDTRTQTLDNGGNEAENAVAGLRQYVRITQDVNSRGNRRYYFDSSDDLVNWTRQNSPYTRADLNGLELQLGINEAQYSTNDVNFIFDDFFLMYQGPGQAWPLTPNYQAGNIDLRPFLSWVPASPITNHLVYVDSNLANVTGRTLAAQQFVRTEPNYQYVALDTLLPTTTYYWVIDENNAGVVTAGDVWSFTTEAAAATLPNPPDAAGGVSQFLAALQWTPYEYATDQWIYFSTSYNNVNNGIGGVDLTAATTSWDPCSTGNLDIQTTYYWKIRSTVGGQNYAGPVWSFTTAFPMNFTDTFTNSWDYFTNGTGGTIWTGVVNEASLFVMNTDATPGRLRIESTGNWGGQTGQGVLLYKEIDGPYIATVEVTNINGLLDVYPHPTTGAQNQQGLATQRVGLMARLGDLRWGRYGTPQFGDSDVTDEDWIFVEFYPTWNVGHCVENQGWRFITTSNGAGNGTPMTQRMWTGWPDYPADGIRGLQQGAPYINKSGRFLQLDYKGHGNGGNTDNGLAGRFYARYSSNGTTWYNLYGDNSLNYNGRDIVNPFNRFGDMNNRPHQVGIAVTAGGTGSFVEFDNFNVGRELVVKATGPVPPTGNAVDIMRATLEWSPGDLANNQRLFFDTNETNVRNATLTTDPTYVGDDSSGEYVGLGSADANGMYTRYRYDVVSDQTLVLGTTYFWKVTELDEVSVPPISWASVADVWNFSLQSYSTIDSFEAYSSSGAPGTAGSLRATWIDGRVGVGYNAWNPPVVPPDPQGSSGSYVQLASDTADGNTSTTNTTYSGGRGSKLYYDNDQSIAWLVTLYNYGAEYTYTAPRYSEISAAIDDAARLVDASRGLFGPEQESLGLQRDWRAYKALRIPYYGNMTLNTKTANDVLYAVLQDGDGDTVRVNCPDTDAVIHQGWHLWYIALQDFNTNNVDLDDVARIKIGVGLGTSSGGRGAIFIDEIQIQTSATICAPVNPSIAEVTPVLGDFSFNCQTNVTDLRYLLGAWLEEPFAGGVPPTAPIIKIDATAGVTTIAGNKVTNWASTGSIQPLNFVDFNTPQTGYRPTLMANVEGKQAVWFDGNDFMKGDVNTPLALTGANPWTIITTIYRDGSQSAGFDAEYFGWTNRGDVGQAGNAGAASYSQNTYGAYAGWSTDRGWGRYFPPLHQWHQIAITYQGGTNGKFYAIADGKIITPDPSSGTSQYNTPTFTNNIKTDRFGNGLKMTIGSVYAGNAGVTPNITGGASTAWWLTGAIAKMEVYNYYMTAGQLMWLTGGGASPLDMSPDNIIDFKDIAVFATNWMVTDYLTD